MKGAVLALCLAILVVSCIGGSVQQSERQQSATAVQGQDARAAANKTADANISSAEKPPEIAENTQTTASDPAESFTAGNSVQTPAAADAQGAQLDAAAAKKPRSSRPNTNGRDRRTPNTSRRARAGNAAKTALHKLDTFTASGDVTPASIPPSSTTAAEDLTAEQQVPASDTEQVQAGATPQADHKPKHRTGTVEDASDKGPTEHMTGATQKATEQQKADVEEEEQFGQAAVVSVEQEVQQQQHQQWHKQQRQEQEQKQQKQEVVPATVQALVPKQATEAQNLALAVDATEDDATILTSVEKLVQQFEEGEQENDEAQGASQLQGQSNAQTVNLLVPGTQTQPQPQAQAQAQAQTDTQAQAQVQIKTEIQSQSQPEAPVQAEVQTTIGAVKALPTSTASRLRVAGIDTSITPLSAFGAAAASEATKPVLLTLTAKPAIAAAAAAAAPAMPADGLIRAGTQVAAFLIKALQAASNSTAAAAAAGRDSPDEQDAMGGLIDAAFGSRLRGNAGQFGATGQMVNRPGGPAATATRNGPSASRAFARPAPNARGPSGNANSRNANGNRQAASHIAGQGPSARQGHTRPGLTAKHTAGSRKVQVGASGARPHTNQATKQNRPTSTHPSSKASVNKPAAKSAPRQQHSKASPSRT